MAMSWLEIRFKVLADVFVHERLRSGTKELPMVHVHEEYLQQPVNNVQQPRFNLLGTIMAGIQ